MAKTRVEPFVWLAFSGGGVVAALFIPILLFLFGIAFPLGWITPPTYEHLESVVSHPLTALILFGVCVLALLHWAHRFRFTLYDGLRMGHLAGPVAAVCYGGVVVGTVASAVILIQAL